MAIEIDLTQLNLEQLEELSQVINDSIDYSIETEEMQIIHLINDLYQVVDKKGNIKFQGNKYLCKSYLKICES